MSLSVSHRAVSPAAPPFFPPFLPCAALIALSMAVLDTLASLLLPLMHVLLDGVTDRLARALQQARRPRKTLQQDTLAQDESHARLARDAALYALCAGAITVAYQTLLRSPLPPPLHEPVVPECMVGLHQPPVSAEAAPLLAPPGSVESFILCAPRVSASARASFLWQFVLANREGLFSTAGYLALHFMGLAWGRAVSSIRARYRCSSVTHVGDLTAQGRGTEGEGEETHSAHTAEVSRGASGRRSAARRRHSTVAAQLLPLPGKRAAGPAATVVAKPTPTTLATGQKKDESEHVQRQKGAIVAALYLFAASALLLWIAYALSIGVLLPAAATGTEPWAPPSRRLANAPYVCLSLALNATQMCIYLLAAYASAAEGVSEPAAGVLESVNAYFFPAFLAANLSTGIVNGSVWTLDTGTGPAVLILACHMGLLTTAATEAKKRGVRVKLKL